MTLAGLWLTAALAAAPPAAGPSVPEPPPTEVAEVVVTARRIGVPVWRVGDERSAVVFIGSVGLIPEGAPWNAEALEQAVAGSRGVLHTATVAAGVGDVARLLFRAGRYTDLPRGRSLDTQIGPALSERIDRLSAAGRIPRGWRNARAWWVAVRLRGSLSRDRSVRRGTSAMEAAERAARRARLPVRPVLQARFNDVLQQAARDRPTDLGCLEAVVAATESGVEGARTRAVAWTRSRLAEIAASPLSRAEAVCWPEVDRESAPALRGAWRSAVRTELTRPGAVVAVVPLTYLVETGGLLDDLQAQGHRIDGPAWR